MNCTACGHLNPERAQFCGECGTALVARCPQCGAAVTPGLKFCFDCGSPVTSGPTAIHATGATAARAATSHAIDSERRQLTVMFCDLADSMQWSARLDPEELRELMHSYHEVVTEVVARFEGFVAQHLGDGMLVYFGYPQAHEDDSARALHAGLEVLSNLSPLRSLTRALARRRRAREITKAIESRVYASFEQDIGAGFLQVHPVFDEHLVAALSLISRVERYPLRTLDALHLAIAQGIHCRRLATADKAMANAGKAIGFGVARFF